MGRVAVLGAGSWGTALAKHLARKGEQVRLWSRRPELAAEMQRTRENPAYLRGVVLPETLLVTSELPQALDPRVLPPAPLAGRVGGHVRRQVQKFGPNAR